MKKCRKREPGPHHWVIEAPDGAPNSLGRCINCGDEKLHANWSPSPGWGDGKEIQDNDKSKAAAVTKRQERAALERGYTVGLPKRKHVKKYGLEKKD